MLREYLTSAQEVLVAKKEIFDVKHQRLLLAQDEYNLLNALAASRTSCEFLLLLLTYLNGKELVFIWLCVVFSVFVINLDQYATRSRNAEGGRLDCQRPRSAVEAGVASNHIGHFVHTTRSGYAIFVSALCIDTSL